MELFGRILLLIFAAMVLWGLWRATQPRRAFVIQVRRGDAQVIAGTVTPAFLEQVREVVASHGLQDATVSGIARGTFIVLHFSPHIPPGAREQLRNWWGVCGWGIGRRRAAARD